MVGEPMLEAAMARVATVEAKGEKAMGAEVMVMAMVAAWRAAAARAMMKPAMVGVATVEDTAEARMGALMEEAVMEVEAIGVAAFVVVVME